MEELPEVIRVQRFAWKLIPSYVEQNFSYGIIGFFVLRCEQDFGSNIIANFL